MDNEELQKIIEKYLTKPTLPKDFTNKIQGAVIKSDKKTYIQSDVETTIDTSGASATVLDYPDGFLEVQLNNKRYKIPYYEI